MRLATSAIGWMISALRTDRRITQSQITGAEEELREIVEYAEGLERQLDKIRKVLDGEM